MYIACLVHAVFIVVSLAGVHSIDIRKMSMNTEQW